MEKQPNLVYADVKLCRLDMLYVNTTISMGWTIEIIVYT